MSLMKASDRRRRRGPWFHRDGAAGAAVEAGQEELMNTRNPEDGCGAASRGRRAFVASGVSTVAGLWAASALGASPLSPATTTPATATSRYPEGFLWGVATAAHQVEGNNVNNDAWLLEHMTPSMFAEPSGDACDQYHRYLDDIKLVASLGFNTYRFSVEWARIEPERGAFSRAELEHYRRIAAACREHGLLPMVTFWHFTSPRWFAAMGGWENAEAGDLFVRYCERVAEHLGDLIGAATTFNEPNIPALIRWLFASMPQNPLEGIGEMMKAAAARAGSDKFSFFMMADPRKLQDTMVPAHHRALTTIKSGPGRYPVGVNIAIQDEQAVGPDSSREEKCEALYGVWLDAAATSDFVGVQTYTRARVGKDGDLPPEPEVELTQMGYEFWPEALEQTIRYAASHAKVPVYVTENGVATEDDARRVEYIERALAGVEKCLADGIDVRGYIHWSFLDNFEWMFGYRPKFGLVAVDRETQTRTVKPSARYLGEIARRKGASRA
jgi:beta-glucosidase